MSKVKDLFRHIVFVPYRIAVCVYVSIKCAFWVYVSHLTREEYASRFVKMYNKICNRYGLSITKEEFLKLMQERSKHH
jgi:hypothetical protein